MPWWAPLGGLVGAVQVYAGPALVNKMGAGPFVGFTVTAALIASLVVNHFGLFHMPVTSDKRMAEGRRCADGRRPAAP
jgi:transporter family-2 protein